MTVVLEPARVQPRIIDPYFPGVNSENFDLAGYLADIRARYPGLLDTTAGRKALTRLDPLLFSIVYLKHHVSTEGMVSFADPHFEWANAARQWVRPNGLKEDRHAYVAPRDLGKALDIDTPVLTANRGWVRHGEIEAGDSVFGPDGRPTRVVAVRHWADRPVYRLTFSDGEQIVADANHEWQVHDRHRGRRQVRTTGQIAGDWLLTDRRGYREVRYSVPVAGALQYPEADLPVPPYLLGLWLGDGSTGSGTISENIDDIKQFEQFLTDDGETVSVTRPPSAAGRDYARLTVLRQPGYCLRGHPVVYGQVGARSRAKPCRQCIKEWPRLPAPTNLSLIKRLARAGVLRDKHVPDSYYAASVEQRLSLLRGLMDSDGHVTEAGYSEYSGTNERLVRGVHRLVLTLGIKATIRQGDAQTGGRITGPRWRVSFKTTLPVFRLPRKLARLPESVRAAGNRRIVNVERVADRPTNCIAVDHPTHLYLAGESLIPTHNSTWWFLILPMWASAHGHIKFAAAFAHSGTQSETHLHAFRSELGENHLLRRDFPDLCSPARKPNGKTTADNIQMLRCRSGFAFAARGVDAANLGLKEKDTRPDLILLDDVEPDEASYSQYQMEKRRGTIIEAILPMNLRAHVVLVGTVTMPGSIVHQLVAKARGDDEVEKWVQEEGFIPHHHHPILLRDDGTERSIWPYKWPVEFLQGIRRTRSYAKNFLNDPVGNEGGYWTVDDFTHETLPNVTKQILAVDPAITTKTTSDPTGVSIMSFAPAWAERDEHGRVTKRWPSRISVDFAAEVRLVGENLRNYLVRLVQQNPRVSLIVVEANQAGEHWHSILHHMPVKVVIVYSTAPKEVRAANLLELYQHNPPRVVHSKPLPLLEQQMASFPKGKDDLVDSVGSVANRVLAGTKMREGTVFPR